MYYGYNFMQSVENGNLTLAKMYLGEDNNLAVWSDNWAIIAASKRGYLSLIELLVQCGADVKARSNCPIIVACEHGHLKVVRYLVSQGADIHANDDACLMRASENNHVSIVKYLLSRGVAANTRDSYGLLIACAKGNLDMVKFLVENGADISVLEYAPVRYAIPYVEILKYLVSQGACVTGDNNLVLVSAIVHGYVDVVAYLLSLGVCYDYRNEKEFQEALRYRVYDDFDLSYLRNPTGENSQVIAVIEDMLSVSGVVW